jgi:hypothetical protein
MTRAVIFTRANMRYWICPNCRTTIGECLGSRLVVVIARRRFTFPLTPGLRQTCPKCGTESEYQPPPPGVVR